MFDDGWLAKVTLEAKAGAYQVVNTLHYDLAGNFLDDAPSLQSLADRLNGDLLGPYRALFGSQWTISPITVVQEKDPLNPDAVRQGRTAGSGAAGTRSLGAGEGMPSFCCRVYKLATNKIGRSFRGRLFIGGSILESDTINETFLAPAAGNFASLADAFVNAIPLSPDLVFGPTTATAHWVVYSPTRRGRAQDDYATPVVTKVPRTLVHSLRSRAQY